MQVELKEFENKYPIVMDISNIIQFEEVHNVIIDCEQGDKFLVKEVSYNKNDKSLVLHLNKESMKWIEMDGKYPIKITNNK